MMDIEELTTTIYLGHQKVKGKQKEIGRVVYALVFQFVGGIAVLHRLR
jgi:hypothetical protein